MNSIKQLERQQVGVRLPKYLVDELDEFTKQFSVNRTDIIIEAIKSYISEQKAIEFYNNFNSSCKELKDITSKQNENVYQTLDELIDELEDN